MKWTNKQRVSKLPNRIGFYKTSCDRPTGCFVYTATETWIVKSV